MNITQVTIAFDDEASALTKAQQLFEAGKLVLESCNDPKLKSAIEAAGMAIDMSRSVELSNQVSRFMFGAVRVRKNKP